VATRRVKRSRLLAKAAVLELPLRGRIELRRLIPSGRSVLVAFSMLAAGVAAYGVARETPLFAIRRVEVVGAPAPVRARVSRALRPLDGETLVGFRRAQVDRLIASLPDVVGASYDRAFPHTLRVVVRAETPLVVLRRGGQSWLVSTRGRIVRPLPRGARPALPRLWVRRDVDASVGDTIADAAAQQAVRVLAAAAVELPARVRTAEVTRGETTVVVRSGVAIRLGREHDTRLKLAVAARILPQLGSDVAYLDVAVPDRPVAGTETRPRPDVER